MIRKHRILEFELYLREKERTQSTIRKYVATIYDLQKFIGNRKFSKILLLDYVDYLKTYCKARTINSKISAINSFMKFLKNESMILNYLRVQKHSFVEPDRELSEVEYRKLLEKAKFHRKDWLYYLILTLAGTGIRIGELKYITVEAVRNGFAEVSLKKKNHKILIPKELRRRLLMYARQSKITKGLIFRTRKGTPLDRSNICRYMKEICSESGVSSKKVFPHNFRHLFARRFYSIENDLSHLADILGHTSIETTRIYVATSVEAYEDVIDKMQLIS